MTDDRLFLRVGAVVLVGLVLAVGGVVLLGGRHLVPGFRVQVQMDRSGPIQEGTPVRLAGRTIGEVQAIRMSKTGVTLDLWIQRAWRPHLRRGSEFFVNQATVFAEAYLEVGPPRAGEPGPLLEDGAVVRGINPPRLDRLLLKSYQNLEAVTGLLRDGLPELEELERALDELEATIDQAEPDPGAYARTWAAGARFFDEGAQALAALRASGTSLAQARRTASRARALVARARRDLGAVSDRLGHLAGDVGRLADQLGGDRLVRFDRALDEARRLAGEVERLLGETEALVALVERGEGTLGAFLHDEEIADDLKQLMKLMKTRPWTTVGHPQ